MEERQTLAPGTRVYSADGEQIGTIQSSDNSYFVVEGDVLPADVQIPLSAIVLSREGEVHLSASTAEALDQRWTQEPSARVEPGSEYMAVQGEDSLAADPMAMPGQGKGPRSSEGRSVAGDHLERPSGMTGPETTG